MTPWSAAVVVVDHPRENHTEVTAQRVRDVDLAAIEHVAIPASASPHLQRSGIGSGVGLGEAEPPEPGAVEHRHQESLPLLGGAAGQGARHHALHVDGGAQRTPAAAGLLHQNRLHHRGQAVAARFDRDPAADVPESGQLGKQFPREGACAFMLGDQRSDPLVHERAHGLLQRQLVVVEEG